MDSTLLCGICCCGLVANSYLTHCNNMDYSPSGSSVHRNFQAGILEWVAISFSKGSSQPRDWTHVSCIGTQILYHWAPREAHCILVLCIHPFWKCIGKKQVDAILLLLLLFTSSLKQVYWVLECFDFQLWSFKTSRFLLSSILGMMGGG